MPPRSLCVVFRSDKYHHEAEYIVYESKTESYATRLIQIQKGRSQNALRPNTENESKQLSNI
ncbi:hypothetical protein PROFUN_02149 [Planoprotostelium fungivorum]|uniref:Uncharacterized protein n=1 Tax=Planoprotostelium fungivorum TaxID=1890364 RepID=A0A2P6NZ83_9EUKA|nr:hypothetical protein PROFUN_02149 [Planoprotostelium fungivorum]